MGNDSRCPGSWKATCRRLQRQRADCRWKTAYSGPSGKCSGGDSRCGSSSKNQCDVFTNQGVVCKWREAFSANGGFQLESSNPLRFAQDVQVRDALKKGLARVTGVGKSYIDLDISLFAPRRLAAKRHLSATLVTVTYSIEVDVDALDTIHLSGDDVRLKLAPSNMEGIASSIKAEVAEATNHQYNFTLQSVETPVVGLETTTSGSLPVAAISGTAVVLLPTQGVEATLAPAPNRTAEPDLAQTMMAEFEASVASMNSHRKFALYGLVVPLLAVFPATPVGYSHM